MFARKERYTYIAERGFNTELYTGPYLMMDAIGTVLPRERSNKDFYSELGRWNPNYVPEDWRISVPYKGYHIYRVDARKDQVFKIKRKFQWWNPRTWFYKKLVIPAWFGV